jgi:hypothetical protein
MFSQLSLDLCLSLYLGQMWREVPGSFRGVYWRGSVGRNSSQLLKPGRQGVKLGYMTLEVTRLLPTSVSSSVKWRI